MRPKWGNLYDHTRAAMNIWNNCLAVLLLAMPLGAQAFDDLTATRPNIVVVLTDDQGYGDAGCNGNPILKTPNLDRLHREGVRFSDFHVSPTCSPTRSSLLTGKHEFKNGVTHTIHERERMSLKSVTLAQTLKTAGYTTGIFGKWHLGDEDAYQPQNRGFDEVFIHGAGGIGQSYPGTCGDAPGNSYFNPVIRHNGRFEKSGGYCTDVFFAQAVKWMESVRGRQPFFAFITPNAPHAPLDCPPEYEKIYAAKVGAREAKFLGMVANIDDNVGRMLDRLKDLGLEGKTLVVFLNDNGGTAGCDIFNAGMKGQKGAAHNGGSRAMSFWRWPGTIHPGACDRLAAHVDIFPTLAELAGAWIPAETRASQDGFSLVPLLSNPNAAWHDDRILFTHVGRWPVGEEPEKYGPCSVRWRQYLLWRDKNRWALYDLKADPGEQNDVAASRPQVIAILDHAYDQWWAGVLPCLENEQAFKTAPKSNPFREAYYKQYNGPGPNNVPPNNRLNEDTKSEPTPKSDGGSKPPP
jgi:arylsulfatase